MVTEFNSQAREYVIEYKWCINPNSYIYSLFYYHIYYNCHYNIAIMIILLINLIPIIMSKRYTYYSDDNCYDNTSAYYSALNKVRHNHKDYHKLSTITDSWYCEGCNDYHYSCEITIELPHNAPTDLEIRLREALNI